MHLDALAIVTPDGAASPPSEPRNPAEVLARLMDFSGAVALAELLHERAPSGPAHPAAAQRAHRLQQNAQAHLDAILPLALEPLSFERVSAPTANELLAAVAHATGNSGRAPRGTAVKRLAHELGAPLHAALASSLERTQTRFAALRAKFARELRELGPRADRLERIDAALQRSIQDKLAQVFARMELVAELSFERACTQACAALPKAFGADDLAPWAAEGGCLFEHRALCTRMARGLYGHLRRGFEGLLAAIAAAEAE